MPRQPIASSGVPGRTIYFPTITGAHVARQFAFGAYRAILLVDCTSVGKISYSHLLYVRHQDNPVPLLAMAAEIANDIPDDNTRCLSMFFQGRHYNFGFSSDWLDAAKFADESLAIAMEQLVVTDKPQELPINTDSGFRLSFLE